MLEGGPLLVNYQLKKIGFVDANIFIVLVLWQGEERHSWLVCTAQRVTGLASLTSQEVITQGFPCSSGVIPINTECHTRQLRCIQGRFESWSLLFCPSALWHASPNGGWRPAPWAPPTFHCASHHFARPNKFAGFLENAKLFHFFYSPWK